MEFRKIPLESEILALLKAGQIRLPPLNITVEDIDVATERGIVDAFVGLAWGDQRYRFVAECKRLWTPKALSQQVDQVRRYARPPDYYPLVVVPYLPGDRLAELEAEGVSGIDLCGNGVVVIPNELLVYRTGSPNRFRSEAQIKNVFRGSSSLVVRAFLLLPEYASVQEAQQEIEKRGGTVALSTVSKVCKSLEELLVVASTPSQGSAARRLRLLQPDKLLDLLAANYVPPSVARVVRGKTKLKPEAFREALSGGGRNRVKVVQTGLSSVNEYAVMAREPMQYFYSTDVDATVRALGDAFEPTDRFANVTLSETTDDTVYFDRRPKLVASPVQTYLELVTGDKRSQETAEQVRRTILTPLSGRERAHRSHVKADDAK